MLVARYRAPLLIEGEPNWWWKTAFILQYYRPLEATIKEKTKVVRERRRKHLLQTIGDSIWTWTWSFSNTGSDFRSAALQHRLLPRLRRQMEPLGGMKPGPRPSEATAHAARCPAGLAPDDIPLNKIRWSRGDGGERGPSFLYTSCCIPAANDAALWWAMVSSSEASPFLAYSFFAAFTLHLAAPAETKSLLPVLHISMQCQRGFMFRGLRHPVMVMDFNMGIHSVANCNHG